MLLLIALLASAQLGYHYGKFMEEVRLVDSSNEVEKSLIPFSHDFRDEGEEWEKCVVCLSAVYAAF
jgi:hypothetical protein